MTDVERRSSPTMTAGPDAYALPVLDVARALIGCTVEHAGTTGLIVETEAYHETEAACHAHVGLTPRTHILFGPPGRAYVYRSYGIHALFNVVTEPEGVGAAVLVRALEPTAGLGLMRARRGRERTEELCSGPGKLTRALGIELGENGTELGTGPIRIHDRPPGWPGDVELLASPRIGITRAAGLPWRFSLAGSRFVSRPWPAGLRETLPPRCAAAPPGLP